MRVLASESSWGLEIRHQPGLHSETSFKRQKQESCDLRQELIPGQAERSPDARHGWNSCGCYTVALAGKWEPRGGSSTESKGRNTWPRREAKCGAEEIGDSTWGGRRSKCGDVDGTRTGREQAACSAVHRGSKVGQSTPALTESLGKQSNRECGFDRHLCGNTQKGITKRGVWKMWLDYVLGGILGLVSLKIKLFWCNLSLIECLLWYFNKKILFFFFCG